jgi:hypothetical protein
MRAHSTAYTGDCNSDKVCQPLVACAMRTITRSGV